MGLWKSALCEIHAGFLARRPLMSYPVAKRLFDLLAAILATVVFLLPILAVAVCVRITSKGPALYWSDRVGRHNRIFRMPKFRSMRTDTPAVATHLLADPQAYLTPIGSFLRRSSLDELPQLWCILKGEMSLVGPRPALFNQHDLIALRTACGVEALPPGLTGWAQINGRDELPIPAKVKLDEEYLKRRSFAFDLRIIMLTILKVLGRDGVAH
jgi:O-antigen biosynthesis protein WbqP